MTLGIGAGSSRVGGSGSIPQGGSSGSAGPHPPFSVEEAQHIDSRVGAANVKELTQAAPSKTPNTPAQSDLVKSPQITRRELNSTDLNRILIESGTTPTPEKRDALATLIRFGLEASAQNVQDVSQLTQNSSLPNAVESAVISLSKGLNQPKSVDAVSKFLNNQASITQNLAQLQTSLQQFITTIQRNPNPVLLSLSGGVLKIAEHLDKSLKKLEKSNQDGKPSGLLLNQGKVIKDFHLFAGLMLGYNDKVQAQDPELARNLKNPLKMLKESIGLFIENLLTQSILSTSSSLYHIGHDEFAYWQIPNPMSQKQSSMDILIKREPQRRGEKQRFDSQKTKIIVKCETQDIGELAIIIEITGQKVQYVFYTQNEETKSMILSRTADLKDRMNELNFELIGVHTSHKRVNIRKLLLPTVNFDKLSRIDAKI